MITAHDVNTVTFPKAMRGYNADDVDKLLDSVAAQLEADAAEIETLKKVNEEQKGNMYLLAQKIDEYRADEDNLKSALINAQRMGENIIREAKQKADGILREASVRAEGIVIDAQHENAAQEIELQRVKAEVAQFKADVLSLYKRHIESLSTLPEEEKMQEEETVVEATEEEIALVAAQVLALDTPAQEVVEESEPDVQEVASIMPEMAQESQEIAMPEELEEMQANSFWTQDENDLKEGAPSQDEAQDTASVFEAFKGIKFSD